MTKRCDWVNPNNSLYVDYHDHEWGQEVHDDRLLFEFLVLEGTQAGLSWETILNKREEYKKVFDDFDANWIRLNSLKLLTKDNGLDESRITLNKVIEYKNMFNL